MKEKNLEESKSQGSLTQGSLTQPRPYVQIPNIDKLFEPHGIYDGKMFYTTDKATYTFVDKKEVVSLHFDKRRQAIFYRGHNIANLNLTDDQKNHLERFSQELEKDPHTRTFAAAYSKALNAATKQNLPP